jgi:aspartyl-tRNA(Asn)/glutamyl-tRNA(Gln) amidotransferase subunit B
VTEPAWEVVIGLEVHCELATTTKMFCGCPNEFGTEPNTNVCPVCLGLPGSLPVVNERAVEFALRIGTALHCTMPPSSLFHRKNYFYPDMPKNYQISQYDEPICVEGWLEVDGQRVGILRAHLEEDTGKTTHIGGGGRIHDARHSLVDYNRAGVPLIEIVSHPDITSSEQARAYVSELRALLGAIGVSDVKMEEGSLRVDANISVRRTGDEKLGTKVEIKNMNSLRSLGRALDYERERQIGLLDAGETIVQETRHWNEADATTHSMRTKEGSSDYRYFSDPDLVPIAPTDEWRAHVAASLPELPAARRGRLVEAWGIDAARAALLVATPGLADYAEEAVAAGGPARDVAVWCTEDVLAFINETATAPRALGLVPDALAELLGLVGAGTISRNQARDVLAEALQAGTRPRAIVDEQGLAQVSDESALARAVDDVLATHTDEVDRFRAGDHKERKKLRGFLMGQAMKALGGQGNPQVLSRILDERLGEAR